jgi:hypothetical protein
MLFSEILADFVSFLLPDLVGEGHSLVLQRGLSTDLLGVGLEAEETGCLRKDAVLGLVGELHRDKMRKYYLGLLLFWSINCYIYDWAQFSSNLIA